MRILCFKERPLINKKIGSKIRQLRKGWGLSQIELAEKVGISFQQIQKYEKGATRISVMRLHEISDALGVSITAFFEKEEGIAKVSDPGLRYTPGGENLTILQPLDKQEIALLRLFRKIGNKKMREGILKQLQGIIELESSR